MDRRTHVPVHRAPLAQNIDWREGYKHLAPMEPEHSVPTALAVVFS
jgi:hypothetical protein